MTASECQTVSQNYLDAVADMQRRLELLELRLNDRVHEAKESRSLLDQLVAIDDSVKTITRGKDKFSTVLSKVTEIERVLSYPDFSSDDIASKKALLLLSEHRIRQENQLLSELSQYQAALESFSSRDFASLLPAIEKIRQTSLLQAEEAKEIRNEVRKLVLTYAQMVETTRSLLEGLSSKCKSSGE